MTDTAVRIGPASVGSGETTLYTATGTGIIKWLHIANVTGTAATVKMSVGADAAGTRVLGDVSVPANDFLDLDVFLPITTTLRAQSGTNNALTVTGGVVEVT